MIEFIQRKTISLIHGFGLDNFPWEVIFFSIVVSFIAFFIEFLVLGWENSSLKKIFLFEKSTRTDFICWLLDTFNLSNIFGFILSLGICYYLVGVFQKNIDIHLITSISNPYVQVVIIFLAGDFKNYIRHYVFHKSNTLWEIHQFHHSATNFNILTRQRVHFLESELSRFFDVFIFILLGSPIYTFLAVRLLKEVHQMLIHSSFTSDWGLIGKYILVSPAAHRIHHSTEIKHFNKNMGNTFIFWDRIFGTYYPAEKVAEIGVPNNPFNKEGYFRDLWRCLKGMVRTIKIKKVG